MVSGPSAPHGISFVRSMIYSRVILVRVPWETCSRSEKKDSSGFGAGEKYVEAQGRVKVVVEVQLHRKETGGPEARLRPRVRRILHLLITLHFIDMLAK